MSRWESEHGRCRGSGRALRTARCEATVDSRSRARPAGCHRGTHSSSSPTMLIGPRLRSAEHRLHLRAIAHGQDLQAVQMDVLLRRALHAFALSPPRTFVHDTCRRSRSGSRRTLRLARAPAIASVVSKRIGKHAIEIRRAERQLIVGRRCRTACARAQRSLRESPAPSPAWPRRSRPGTARRRDATRTPKTRRT